METADLVAEFLASVDAPNTRRAYRTDVRTFVQHVDDVRTVTPAEVGDFVRGMQQDGRAPSTVRRRLSAVRRFYDWMVANDEMEGNPARTCRADLSRPTQASRSDDTVRTLSRAETEQLIQAATEAGESAVRDRALILTVVYGALRRAEVAAMDVEHVRPLGRHWVIDLPSGETWSSAYVKIPSLVVEAIDAVQAAYDIDEGAIWRSLSNRNRGERMTPDAIYKVVQRTAERAGIANVDVDTLRHTGLRLAVEAGASLQQVQVHARLQHAASVEKYASDTASGGRLGESAVDFVELDVPED
jgi:integrase/recombinase XerD